MSNNLLDGFQTQLRIERGLKILEFGTEILLKRTYLRNCPLSPSPHSNHPGSSADNADLIAELNEYLVNPEGSISRERQGIIQAAQSSGGSASQAKPQPNSIVAEQQVTEKTGKSIGKAASIRQNQQTEERSLSPANAAKAILGRLVPIPVKIGMKVGSKLVSKVKQSFQGKGKEEKQPVFKKTVSESSSEQERQMQFADIDEEKINGKGPEDDEDMGDVQLNSYHSETKPLGTIPEKWSEESIILPKPDAKRSKDHTRGYNLSDFSSLQPDNSVAHSAHQQTHQRQPLPQKACQFPSQLSIKLQKQSSKSQSEASMVPNLLNQELSEIKLSNSRDGFILDPKLNQTQAHILRQISDSFPDEECMQHLLKLENYELQEKFLLQRMEKRFQSCSKDIESIRSISWSSLNLPSCSIKFKRPDYAHCYPELK